MWLAIHIRSRFNLQAWRLYRDRTANLLSQVCHEVNVEPLLQPLTGESFETKSTVTDSEARVDISARSFWVRGQVAFLDVKAFSP